MYNGYFITLILDWLEENYLWLKENNLKICFILNKEKNIYNIVNEETYFYNVGYIIKEMFKIN